MGLLLGWWLSSEPYRGEGFCVPLSTWNMLLQDTGFTGVEYEFRDYRSDACLELSVLHLLWLHGSAGTERRWFSQNPDLGGGVGLGGAESHRPLAHGVYLNDILQADSVFKTVERGIQCLGEIEHIVPLTGKAIIMDALQLAKNALVFIKPFFEPDQTLVDSFPCLFTNNGLNGPASGNLSANPSDLTSFDMPDILGQQ
ncbi:uncharacterized protein BO97DRAFT_412058 [Aspergillus homomorphus CBS 101889]|uniref:Uncharacterized protein n=1 Tax=Aspergillus homomorphus (strain CBS 101889) TaxID=1450537 RepID=A0A395I9D7_ASPHC|nr:hypothetical protein BO97DRAFT_412058 [Aspergillus homomorphus CBS 101889]RAL14754.1 hypothetical protein BO97DRAFT_412058 [Aspergillus homomorphus CBS 101889]